LAPRLSGRFFCSIEPVPGCMFRMPVGLSPQPTMRPTTIRRLVRRAVRVKRIQTSVRGEGTKTAKHRCPDVRRETESEKKTWRLPGAERKAYHNRGAPRLLNQIGGVDNLPIRLPSDVDPRIIVGIFADRAH
jgi:hypothetical protein